MPDNFTVQALMGPKYTVVYTDESISVDEEMSLTLNEERYTIAVGTEFNANTVTGTLDVRITATSTVNAFRAIGYDGVFTQPNLVSLSKYAGVTRAAVASGEVATVVRVGLMEENGWNWTPDAPIFITTDGVLTQTVPVVGGVRRVAYALTATKINLEPYPVIGV